MNASGAVQGRAVRSSQFLALAGITATAWLAMRAYSTARGGARAPAEREREELQLVRCSVADSLLFLLDVALPNLAKGVIIRRRRAVALAAALELDRRAVRRMQALRDKYAPGPVLLRMPVRNEAVVLAPAHVQRVLGHTPDPFAAASSEKWSALAHFEPKGALISNGPQRARRRHINEAALDAHHAVHRMAAGFLPIVREEAAAMLTAARAKGGLGWDGFIAAWLRLARRVVLGNGAGADRALTDMLARLRAEANWGFLMPRRNRLRQRFFARLKEHLARAESGSLAALMARLEYTGDEAAQQVPQWLFAFDAAGIATFRALALLALHPDYAALARAQAQQQAAQEQPLPRLRATLLESVRLWPTTPAILRQTSRATSWEGRVMPARTGVLIYAPFFHRDDRQLRYADRFAPELWLDAKARAGTALVPFSDGPAFCPGRELVLLLGSALLAELLAAGPIRLQGAAPDIGRLPGTLNHFALRFTVGN